MIGKRTYLAKTNEIERKWWLIDATGLTLGRLASKIVTVLRGKHKPVFTPHIDTGDFVVVINADKINLTGSKWEDKVYYRHSGKFGHLKTIPIKTMMEKHPDFIIKDAVSGMMPNGALSRAMFKKLRVYGTAEHPHEAQSPTPLELKF